MLDGENEGKMMSIEALQVNVKILDKVRSFFAIVSGIVSGILYLTSFRGFSAYFALSLMINAALFIKMQFDCKKYTNASFASFFFSDLSKNALSFVLFWTVSYALCYIY
jgi:hypothetical protein